MPLTLDPTERLDTGVRAVLEERLDLAIDELERISIDPIAIVEAIHEVRKRCKEIRATLRLLEGTGPELAAKIDRHVERAASALGPLRDASVQSSLSGRPAATMPFGRDDLGQATERSIRHLGSARRITGELALPHDVEALSRGLAHTYRRGRRAWRDAARDPRRLHAWRTAVKRLWYQVRLLEASAPSVLTALVDILDELGELLGDHHDLSQLPGTDDASEAADRRARMGQLERDALRIGATVYAERSRAFAARLTEYWTIAASSGPEPPRSR